MKIILLTEEEHNTIISYLESMERSGNITCKAILQVFNRSTATLDTNDKGDLL